VSDDERRRRSIIGEVEEVKRTLFADSTPRHHQHNMSCTRRGLFVALAVLLLGVTLAQAQVR
jgi:hypothetical protein